MKPDPKSDAKSDPKPDPKPDPKQAEKPKAPDYKPDQIAHLLKKDANKHPPKPNDNPTPQKPAQDAPKFDADQVAELLDQRDPQRQVATADAINDSQPRRGDWRAGRPIVAKRNRRIARPHLKLLEPAAGR